MLALIAVGCFLLGGAVAALSVWATTRWIGLMTRATSEPRQGSGLTIVLGILKLPVLAGSVWLATLPGPWGWGPFLVGAASVYFAFVLRSMHRAQRADQSPS